MAARARRPRDRRAYVIDECGGGHAGHLVRLIALHGNLDEAIVDLLAELVGRLSETEQLVGRLEGDLEQAHRDLSVMRGVLRDVKDEVRDLENRADELVDELGDVRDLVGGGQ